MNLRSASVYEIKNVEMESTSGAHLWKRSASSLEVGRGVLV